MPSRRLERVAELLKQEISKILIQELADPSLGFTTVTEVRPAPDLSTANVYVSVLGDDRVQNAAIKALGRAAKLIEIRASERISLRRFPMLTFRLDDRIKRSIRISKLLHDIAQEREELKSASGEVEGPAERREEQVD